MRIDQFFNNIFNYDKYCKQMTLTANQKQWLQEYLYSSMLYRETYEEVYDHILLALEDKPAHKFFESTVSDIIEDDFGDSSKMLEMERKCCYAVSQDMRKQYRNNFISWFKLPLIIGMVVMLLALYYLIIKFKLAVASLFVFTLILPATLIAIRAFKIGHKFGDTKKSIRDDAFISIFYNFIRWYFFCIFFLYPLITLIIKYFFGSSSSITGFLEKISLYSFPIVILVFIMHGASVYQLYQNECKPDMLPS